ncbi:MULTISPECIES: hypothetical protein [Leptolyngbya]|uniref:hypothetical protein n=1 Tax=Leptolyngbya TaxID=47251 RepID=UPI001688CDC8|nr:hypothetical protein [Leptolyngbya sp. FACHB-1624]MBD1854796.1 hypothetical protein [Leptolyngbya sp. FACHB-1624]
MDQVTPLDMVRELDLHRLNTNGDDIEELLAGGASLDDLDESGILGNWQSCEEKAQVRQAQETERSELLQALNESPSNELGSEEF